jgi:hypothetical protein
MPRLLATIDDLHRVSARYFHATWKGLEWGPQSEGEHRAILEAVQAGDGEAAATLLIAHIVEAGRALVRTLWRRRHEAVGPPSRRLPGGGMPRPVPHCIRDIRRRRDAPESGRPLLSQAIAAKRTAANVGNHLCSPLASLFIFRTIE